MGIFELMPLNESLKELILNKSSHIALEKQNQAEGNNNLWQSGLACVQNKLTSLSEIYRVVSHHV
jgi:type IV pilus assembly protein PilB